MNNNSSNDRPSVSNFFRDLLPVLKYSFSGQCPPELAIQVWGIAIGFVALVAGLVIAIDSCL